ncbi:MAG: hypothetical protein IJX77_09145 [Ruminococcus sp.]|nr:hypothetical protein [Ruminococcus sp.]
MKKLIFLISALTMCAAVPMNVSAEDCSDPLVDGILANFSSYDFNADGVTDFADARLILQYYAWNQTGYIETNEIDRTYTILNDEVLESMSEDVMQRILATGNITNPEWDPERKYSGVPESFIDGIEAIDASYIRTAVAMYYGAGDTNTDGAVDSLDASAVLNYYAMAQLDGFDEEYFNSLEREGVSILGDYNEDGAINSLDASDILAHYANAQTATAE